MIFTLGQVLALHERQPQCSVLDDQDELPPKTPEPPGILRPAYLRGSQWEVLSSFVPLAPEWISPTTWLPLLASLASVASLFALSARAIPNGESPRRFRLRARRAIAARPTPAQVSAGRGHGRTRPSCRAATHQRRSLPRIRRSPRLECAAAVAPKITQSLSW